MKLPVRLSPAHAHLMSGDNTYWCAMHRAAARMWVNRLATIPNEAPFLELRDCYREMARNAGEWARQCYEKCVEEYLANG